MSQLKNPRVSRDSYGNIANHDDSALPLISHIFPKLYKKMALLNIKNVERLPFDNAYSRLICLYDAYKLGEDASFIENNWHEILDFIAYNFSNLQEDSEQKYICDGIIREFAKLNRDRKLAERHNTSDMDIDIAFHRLKMQKSNTYSSICKMLGLKYNLHNKAISLSPDMQYANHDEFVSILMFDNFIGFIERGIDYIQINCVKGRITLRTIEAPDIPLKVRCGNVSIGFSKTEKTAKLDSDCEAVPGRSILVIFKN